jgi:hypothetical protein
MAANRSFHMYFEPMTIEHLGLRLYSTLPPVLSEMISNAYDAESAVVEVSFPTDKIAQNTEVIVRDYGHGMNADELEREYLPIGRNRRGEESNIAMSKNALRKVTGRKGLGKLSSFGVAEEMEVRTVKDGEAWTLRLNYEEMKEWAKQNSQIPYEPVVVGDRTGKTSDKNGVEVRLRKLRRTQSINEAIIRRGLARRLNVIGSGFKVLINGKEIAPGERTRKEECSTDQLWDLSEVPSGNTLETGDEVNGWIGFLPSASQTGRGVDIFANGKAAELGSFFNYSSTSIQFARAHVVGEVHADFLDEEEDLIATARNSVVWESAKAQALQSWGQTLLRWAFERWLAQRHKDKEENITREAGFDKWLESRQPSEQRVAKRMLKLLVNDDSLDPESARPLLEIVKGSIETLAFQELIESIEKDDASPATLLKLFDEWRVIEAREHLRLADGRLSALNKLEEFIEKGALEVTELQPLLVNNLWILNHKWVEVDVQPTYTKLLREKCPESSTTPEEERRLDIIGVTGGSNVMTVVELKRPEKTLSRKDLEQIERYVDWAEANIGGGSGEDSPLHIQGLLIVGKISKEADVRSKVKRLESGNIRVETYRDLHNGSRERYKEVDKQLERIAPEYSRLRRKASGAKRS